ncbi:MAG: LytR C-terminal domain-containing protein [Ilumatobacter sp.]|uniref:LytR C-terminal domain-containing protein n=1 Tax=Ilumatobacter sp. TaxID=1967498 RepID=UPI00391D038F
MQSPLVVYLVLAAASVGAGVAIASGSEPSSAQPVIESATVDTGNDDLENDGSAPATDVPDTEPVAEPEPADEAATTSTPTEPVTNPTTTNPTTTNPTPTTTVPLADRSVFPIFVANGANIAGVAGVTGDRLSELGYDQIRRGDASEFVDLSAVYVAAELVPFGERLAGDMGIGLTQVLPLDEMPDVGSVNDELLVVYLGRDVVDLLLAPLPEL